MPEVMRDEMQDEGQSINELLRSSDEEIQTICEVSAQQYNEDNEAMEEPQVKIIKSKFSNEEDLEIRRLFSKYFEQKKRPEPSTIRKKLEKSSLLSSRSFSSIKNKIFRMLN